MSDIQKILATATEVEPSKRKNEDITSQDYMKRLAVAVGELSDAEWGKLPAKAQDWYNNAADALKLGNAIEAYPDMTPAAGTRRRGAPADAKPWEPSVGAVVAIVTKRGKNMVGTITELDKDGLVLDDGTELDHDKIANIGPAEGGNAAVEDEPAGPKDPEVGDKVEVETARGKKITGEITALDGDDVVVKDSADEEHELNISKLKTFKLVGATKATAATKPAAAKDEKPADDKPKRVTASANGGVSATQRMRELICADLSADKAAIAAGLKKDGLEFKQATLDLIYADSHKLIQVLRDLKKVK